MAHLTTQQPHHRLPTPRRSPRRTQKTNRRTRRKNRQTHQNTRRTPTRQRPRNRLHTLTRPLARRILPNHRRQGIPDIPPQTIATRRTQKPRLPTLTPHHTKKPQPTSRGFPLYQTDHDKVAEVHTPFAYVISLKGLTYKPVLSNWNPLYSAPAAGTFKSVKFGFT